MSKDPFKDYKIHYKAGEKIFQQGDVGTEMYIVRTGSVQIIREFAGKKEKLSLLEKGDFFGEMAVLEGSPRTNSASAAEETELVRIHSAIFDRMIRRNTKIAVRMILKLSRRVEDANARLQDVLQKVSEPHKEPEIVPGSNTARLPVAPILSPEPVKPSDAPGEIQEPRGQLLLEGGKRVFAVKSDSALIGRYDPVTGDRPEIDLTSVDVGRSVSRRHARMLYRDGSFFLTEEVGALNGTFVGDRKVTAGVEIPVSEGDRLRVGRVVLIFQAGKNSS